MLRDKGAVYYGALGANTITAGMGLQWTTQNSDRRTA